MKLPKLLQTCPKILHGILFQQRQSELRIVDTYLFFKELYLSLILQENEAKDVQC